MTLRDGVVIAVTRQRSDQPMPGHRIRKFSRRDRCVDRGVDDIHRLPATSPRDRQSHGRIGSLAIDRISQTEKRMAEWRQGVAVVASGSRIRGMIRDAEQHAQRYDPCSVLHRHSLDWSDATTSRVMKGSSIRCSNKSRCDSRNTEEFTPPARAISPRSCSAHLVVHRQVCWLRT